MNQGHGLLISSLISQCWDMENVAQQYKEFSATFSPMLEAVNPHTRPSQAFAVRALTLHDRRRIVLHDPQMPRQLMPQDCPGHAARTPFSQLSWTVFDLADDHMETLLGR